MKLTNKPLTSLVFFVLGCSAGGVHGASNESGESSIPHDFHSSLLTCPNINSDDFSHHAQVILSGNNLVKSATITLDLRWRPDDPLPNLRIHSDVIQRAINDITDVYTRFFGQTFPENIHLYQVQLKAGLAALYCRDYQTTENSILLFVAPETLENPGEFRRIVSHELVHHWFYKNNKTQEVWLEEGIAFLIEYLATSKLSGSPVLAHLDFPWTSLTELPDRLGPKDKPEPAIPRLSRNGHNQLLMVYLHRTLGLEFVQRLLHSEKTGIESLKEAIKTKQNPYDWTSFKEAFRDFEIAKWLNRNDNSQTDEAVMQRFFLFPGPLVAQKIDIKKKPQARESLQSAQAQWSSLLVDTYSDLTGLPKPSSNFEDYSLPDETNLAIVPKKIQAGSRPKTQVIRIIYDEN